MIAAYFTTELGNKVRIERVIGSRTTGGDEDLLFGYLNGEPITRPVSECTIEVKEFPDR